MKPSDGGRKKQGDETADKTAGDGKIDGLLPCPEEWARGMPNEKMEPIAFRSALDWHRAVGPNEVLVSSFPWGYARARMVFRIDLSSRKVYAWDDLFKWSKRNSRSWPLSQSQVLAARGLIDQLPPSVKVTKINDLLLMSVAIDGRPKTFVYDRSKLPPTVSRFYDIIEASGIKSGPGR
jgi:hypothetical protein